MIEYMQHEGFFVENGNPIQVWVVGLKRKNMNKKDVLDKIKKILDAMMTEQRKSFNVLGAWSSESSIKLEFRHYIHYLPSSIRNRNMGFMAAFVKISFSPHYF